MGYIGGGYLGKRRDRNPPKGPLKDLSDEDQLVRLSYSFVVDHVIKKVRGGEAVSTMALRAALIESDDRVLALRERLYDLQMAHDELLDEAERAQPVKPVPQPKMRADLIRESRKDGVPIDQITDDLRFNDPRNFNTPEGLDTPDK